MEIENVAMEETLSLVEDRYATTSETFFCLEIQMRIGSIAARQHSYRMQRQKDKHLCAKKMLSPLISSFGTQPCVVCKHIKKELTTFAMMHGSLNMN